MLKGLLIATPLVLAQPAMAAMVTMDLTFEREFFQNVFDFDTLVRQDVVYDGSELGFSGRFSDLSVGDTVGTSFSVEETDGQVSVSNCVFAGTSCESAFVELSQDMGKLFLAGTGTTSLSFDFPEGSVVYYEDGPGGMTGLGMFDFYGAEFAIGNVEIEETTVVPLPASGWILLGALAALGFAARRRTA